MIKILIVEDDALIIRMFENMIKSHGFEVVTANDGIEGLEKAGLEKPDMILLDIMLPRLNGLEVLEKLKLNPETADIPVVVLTNLMRATDEHDVMSRGAVKYLDKSQFDMRTIGDLVKEVLGEQVGQSE